MEAAVLLLMSVTMMVSWSMPAARNIGAIGGNEKGFLQPRFGPSQPVNVSGGYAPAGPNITTRHHIPGHHEYEPAPAGPNIAIRKRIPGDHEPESALAGSYIFTRHHIPGHNESESAPTGLNITIRHHVRGHYGNNGTEPIPLAGRTLMPCHHRHYYNYGRPCHYGYQPLLGASAGAHAAAGIGGGFSIGTPLLSVGAGVGLGASAGLGASGFVG